MRAVVQRVSSASVTIGGQVVGEIGTGFLVLLGVAEGDTEADADYLADKIAKLRVFRDDDDKMNLCLRDVNGGVLVVSQFTLHADTRKGNRPSFIRAAGPELGEKLYEYTVERLRAAGLPVACGRFGAMMDVALVNSGPVTIILDSEDRKRSRREG
ncbi:D-tyrosyl-tRNA(Tyr) deacylase [bacterium]|nr:D-tyrosyl-tRNA(Tyr) deacylase [bacterium]